MDILRYASATAYLRIPIGHVRPVDGLHITEPTSVGNDFDTQGAGDSMDAIGKGLGSIGDGWKKLSDSIANRASETVTREICLGFAQYEHTVKTLSGQGLDQEHFVKVVDGLIKMAKVRDPDVKDLKRSMELLEIFPNITWTGTTVSYTSDDGFHRFFYFYKYISEITQKIDIVFGMISATFRIAPDVLIIRKNKVRWLGLDRSDTVEFRNVPHTLSPNDTKLLDTYFEVVLYRKLALVQHLPFPDYPDMGPVCPR
ncbi:hypothetical protein BGZ95_005853 [Linnemannia exigua]|uniref:Uncharacterized protein n=1 Tax=Linnemannia exigua TaxID=604196 RepID=A0AAD4D1J3_9FUNG|nr:hypothetical protein BGZ95_005853 [Linnemannia exigua]